MKPVWIEKFLKSPFGGWCAKHAGETKHRINQLFIAKKILIISDKEISSVPVSSKFQLWATGVVAVAVLWVTYSTGQYFAYESIINEKEREIWSTNVTNENLQYQVSDLHKNLKELNDYFSTIKGANPSSAAQLVAQSTDADNSASEMLALSDDNAQSNDVMVNARNVLVSIRNKVMERIRSLESIVAITGLNLDELALNESPTKTSATPANANQGGPFIPADEELFTRREFDTKVSYLMELENMIHAMPLTSPMNKYWVSSPYGPRKDPVHGRPAMHRGIDLVGRFKEKIISPAPGKVTFTGNRGAYGKLVIVDHGYGVTTRYGHLDKILVRKGKQVKRGQVIGIQGNTGRSTGPHLHYEVRSNGKPFNPAKFLKAGTYVYK